MSNVFNASNMFKGCTALTTLDLSGFTASNVTDMRSMFEGCQSLTSLDVSMLQTSRIVVMDRMFYNCSKLTGLDLSSFNVTNMKTSNMANMFGMCNSITVAYGRTSSDVSKFNSTSGKPTKWKFVVKE